MEPIKLLYRTMTQIYYIKKVKSIILTNNRGYGHTTRLHYSANFK